MSHSAHAPSRDLTGIVLAVLVLGILLSASYWVLQPFLPALVWATMIVVASWRLMLTIQNALWQRRSLAILVMTSLLLLVFILPLSIAISAIINNADRVSEEIQAISIHGLPQPPEWVASIPVVGERIEKRWLQAVNLGREELLSRITPYLGELFSWLVRQLGSFGGIVIHLLLTVILAAILYAKGEQGAQGVRHFARRLAHRRGEEAVILAAQAIRAVANGVILTALLQAFMAVIGLVVAGVPYPIILSSLAFLLSVIQIGAGPILIGSIIWLFYQGYTIAAWMFIVWSVLIMLADNFVRPYLIRRGADLPLILIFAGVIGGLISFGIIGIFVGPVVLAISYTWMQAWIGGVEEDSKVAD